MRKNRPIRDIIKVLVSNVFILLSGFLISFFVPKIMSVSAYGYYKTFTLYITYSALVEFGFYEGIYLKYSGSKYEDLPKEKFRTYFRFYALTQMTITSLFFIISCFFINNELKIVFMFTAIYALVYNVTSFFQIISQSILRFGELSARNIIKSILNVISIAIFIVIYYLFKNLIDYKIYVISYILVNVLLCVWYLYTYRELVFGKADRIGSITPDIREFFKNGFPLLIANLCSTLLLTLDRQFVNVLWPVKESNVYPIYAFAYNLLSLVTTLTAAMSVVLFPNLKRITREEFSNSYNKLSNLFIVFIFFCLCSFYPMVVFVNWFLPNYTESINILYIIYPGLAFTSCITVVMQNFYKVEKKNHIFFWKSLVVLLISFIFNLIAYLIFKDPRAISWASIITILIWYLVIEVRYFKISTKNRIQNLIFACLMSTVFYSSVFVSNIYFAFLIYFVSFFFISILMYYSDFKRILSYIKAKKMRVQVEEDIVEEEEKIHFLK